MSIKKEKSMKQMDLCLVFDTYYKILNLCFADLQEFKDPDHKNPYVRYQVISIVERPQELFKRTVVADSYYSEKAEKEGLIRVEKLDRDNISSLSPELINTYISCKLQMLFVFLMEPYEK